MIRYKPLFESIQLSEIDEHFIEALKKAQVDFENMDRSALRKVQSMAKLVKKECTKIANVCNKLFNVDIEKNLKVEVEPGNIDCICRMVPATINIRKGDPILNADNSDPIRFIKSVCHRLISEISLGRVLDTEVSAVEHGFRFSVFGEFESILGELGNLPIISEMGDEITLDPAFDKVTCLAYITINRESDGNYYFGIKFRFFLE